MGRSSEPNLSLGSVQAISLWKYTKEHIGQLIIMSEVDDPELRKSFQEQTIEQGLGRESIMFIEVDSSGGDPLHYLIRATDEGDHYKMLLNQRIRERGIDYICNLIGAGLKVIGMYRSKRRYCAVCDPIERSNQIRGEAYPVNFGKGVVSAKSFLVSGQELN